MPASAIEVANALKFPQSSTSALMRTIDGLRLSPLRLQPADLHSDAAGVDAGTLDQPGPVHQRTVDQPDGGPLRKDGRDHHGCGAQRSQCAIHSRHPGEAPHASVCQRPGRYVLWPDRGQATRCCRPIRTGRSVVWFASSMPTRRGPIGRSISRHCCWSCGRCGARVMPSRSTLSRREPASSP